jgi:hypothetical protein
MSFLSLPGHKDFQREPKENLKVRLIPKVERAERESTGSNSKTTDEQFIYRT